LAKEGHKGRKIPTRRPQFGSHINWEKFVKKDLLEFLHCHGIQNTNVQKADNFFLFHCSDPQNTLRALQLNGEILGRNVLRLTRSDIPLTARENFKLIVDKLRVKEEAQSRRKSCVPPSMNINHTSFVDRVSNSELSQGNSDFESTESPKPYYPFIQWRPRVKDQNIHSQPRPLFPMGNLAFASISQVDGQTKAPSPKVWKSGPPNWKRKTQW
jgi:hypothetical protein